MLALDRLFLAGLVDEVRSVWTGAVIRRVEADRATALLALETSLGKPNRIVISASREAPGIYLGEAPARVTLAVGLKKWLIGARIESIAISELDRVVTLALGRTRLSGRREGVDVVLEVMGPRVAVFVVDAEARTVVESIGHGRKRLVPGDRYQPPSPPPGAAPLAADASELARRISEAEAGGEPGDSDLLAATGATPLVVTEMKFLARRDAVSFSEAFETVRGRLQSGRPTLYVSKGRYVLSPIELESRSEGGSSRSFASFNAAMAEAHGLVSRERAFRTSQERLVSAVRTEVSKLERLRAKLGEQKSHGADPAALRRYGEQILAGLGRARRIRDDAVLLPDAFDPSGPAIEVPIDPRLGLAANAERFFRRARKQVRAAEALARRLGELDLREESLSSLDVALGDAESLEALAELESEAEELGFVRPLKSSGRKVGKPAPLGPRQFTTARGRRVLVGRSSKGNEALTFERAQPDDLWLHASGMAGAHVVLRAEAGVEVSEEDIVEAAGLAAYFSKGRRDAHVEVMVTSRKHVSKIKGAPAGAARVKSYRTLRVAPRLPDEVGRGE